MKDLNLIFFVDKNWNIGVKGDMLYKTQKDLDHFKEITYGQVLVMGRKTLEALPGKNGLEGRTNIVLTRNKDYKAENIIFVESIDALEKELEKHNEEIFLIGGGNLVNQLFSHCTYAYITKMDYSFDVFDTSIPNLDELENWEIVKEEEAFNDGRFQIKFIEYKKIK